MKRMINQMAVRAMMLVMAAGLTTRAYSQELAFSVHADPIISWIGSNESVYKGEGPIVRLDLGLDVLYFFAENYAFSSGISLITAGGNQSVNEDHTMVFNNLTIEIPAGDEIRYNLKYMIVPLGVYLQTNQIGYLTYFTDIGFNINILLKSTVDLPSQQIFDENAKNEVYGMNAGWHIGGGIRYELEVGPSIIAGLSYTQDFFDFTKDLKEANQPDDRSGLRMFRVRLGFMF